MRSSCKNALARLALVLLVVASALAYAQNVRGADYGSRDPVTCPSKRAPVRGAPTAEQVRRYVMCQLEVVMYSPYLILLDNVQVEVNKGRPYDPDTDSLMTDADRDSPVYPIRGSYDMYTCSPIDSSTPRGRNCALTPHPHATGMCYRTTFGDWDCEMTDPNALSPTRQGVAPPR